MSSVSPYQDKQEEYIYCRSVSNTYIHTDITLHYITLHYITLHCITLHVTCYILHITCYMIHVTYYIILHYVHACKHSLLLGVSFAPSAQAQSCGVIPLGPTVTAGLHNFTKFLLHIWHTLGGEVLHRLICIYIYIYREYPIRYSVLSHEFSQLLFSHVFPTHFLPPPLHRRDIVSNHILLHSEA